ncbi:MAG TPA: hypothetical protein VFH51_08065, partial [Myxococcota bacterium]|nr:hypothetical protein [Myxococcota bacterium]
SVYSPEKWSSNVHNLPRMRNKDVMISLCDEAQHGLEAELAGLSRAASDEVPNIINQKKVDAQWVYWYRDAAARASLASFLEKTPLDQATLFNIAPTDKHVTLAIVLRQTEIWVGLRLAPGAVVDRRNLATKLGKSWERERALELIHGLPEGATVGFENALISAADLTLDGLGGYAERLGQHDPAWQIGHSLSVEDAVDLGGDLVGVLHGWLAALAPLYRFTAWTRDNDLIEATKQIQEEKAQKRRQATKFNPGDRVRFIAGLFSGKLGIVQEIDTKAQVKVRVGKMSVVVPGTDLTAAS